MPSGVHVDGMVGPAWIGYADDAAIEGLHSACSALDWEHGGQGSEATARIGVFKGGTLATLASYRIWGDRIAHISIISHPLFRNGGLARIAVSAITRHALDNNLVAQYRTLVSNTPSLAIANRLGFERYATSVVMRLNP